MKQRAFEGLGIGIVVIVLYTLSLKYSLYYIFPYFDWIQHFLGGIGLGMLFSALFRSWKTTFFLVFLVAIGWEIFERIGHHFLPMYINYGPIGDTLIDILCAILGASLVFLTTREK